TSVPATRWTTHGHTSCKPSSAPAEPLQGETKDTGALLGKDTTGIEHDGLRFVQSQRSAYCDPLFRVGSPQLRINVSQADMDTLGLSPAPYHPLFEVLRRNDI